MIKLILCIVIAIFVNLGQTRKMSCEGTTDITRFFEISRNMFSAIQRQVSNSL